MTYNIFIYWRQKEGTSNLGGGSNISKGREVYESIQSSVLKYQITFQERQYIVSPFYINTPESSYLNALLGT